MGGGKETASCSLWLDDRQARKVRAVVPPIAGQEGVRVVEGVGAHQKVGENPLPLSGPTPVLAKRAPRRVRRLDVRGRKLDRDRNENLAKLFGRGEVSPELCSDDLRDDESTVPRRTDQRLS